MFISSMRALALPLIGQVVRLSASVLVSPFGCGGCHGVIVPSVGGGGGGEGGGHGSDNSAACRMVCASATVHEHKSRTLWRPSLGELMRPSRMMSFMEVGKDFQVTDFADVGEAGGVCTSNLHVMCSWSFLTWMGTVLSSKT